MAEQKLVIVQLDAVQLDRTTVSVSTKSLRALEIYAEHWPGEVIVAVEAKPLPSSRLLSVVRRADLPFSVVDRSLHGVGTLRRNAAVTLAMHDVSDMGVIEIEPERLVLYGEFPLAERIRVGQIGSGALGRLRVAAGWKRRGGRLRAMATRAGGYQSNGYPAFDDYGRLSPSAITYFDTRASRRVVEQSEAVSRDGSEPFTVAFSGRHTAAKGPEHVLGAVIPLLEESADLRAVFYGSGDLTPVLRERAAEWGDAVEFRGDLDFEGEWVHDVPRTADLMILPHVQGDPSGTYLESAAVGVPVLGFDNVALQSLVDRHGIGWTVPLGNTNALTAQLRALMADRSALAAASVRGREFMREHHFEAEFARRVEHLRQVADV